MKNLVILAALLLVFINASYEDTTCVIPPNPENPTFLTYDEILECLQSIPFNPKIQKTTMNTISQAMESYVFQDIVLDSPESPLVHIEVGTLQCLKLLI
jgi:hypothetical protein